MNKEDKVEQQRQQLLKDFVDEMKPADTVKQLLEDFVDEM